MKKFAWMVADEKNMESVAPEELRAKVRGEPKGLPPLAPVFCQT